MSRRNNAILITTIILAIGVVYLVVQSQQSSEQRLSNQPHTKNNQANSETGNSESESELIPISDEEPTIITSDIDTSEWKTYRNEELGFELKYPADWYRDQKGYHFSPRPLAPNNDYGIYINSHENSNNLNYAAAINSIIKTWKYKPSELNRVILGDIEMLQSGVLTFFVNNKHIILVNFIPAGEIPLDVYNAFLLTFKFIE